MRFWQKAGLQRKLIVILIGVLALASSVFLAVLAGHYRGQLIGAQAQAAGQVTQLLQGALENAMLKRDIPGLEDILSGLGEQDQIVSAAIIAPDREVRFASGPEFMGQVLDSAEVHQAVASGHETTRYLTAPDGRAILRAVNPVENRAECGACHPAVADQPVNGLLVVDFAADDIRARAFRSTLTLAGIGVLVTALGSTALWLALRRVVIAPIGRLSDASRAIAAGRHDIRAHLPGNDEIARLGGSFDAMSDSLTQSLSALERSESELQALIDAIPDGIRVIGPDFTILKANRAYAEQTGQPLADVIGTPCYRASHGRDAPCLATMVSCPVAELREGRAARMTFRDRHIVPEGGKMAVEVSSAPIACVTDGDGPGCVVEAIRDLDRQMRLSQAERLSEIGLLAAGVAHEIHNPLSSVELAMPALSREVAAGRADRAQEYFTMIREEISKCLQITDNLLKLSAPSGEGRALIDLPPVIDGAMGLLRYEAERRGLTMEITIPEGLRLVIPDADLRMLITNLVMNAFHVMDEGGTLRLSARRLTQTGQIELRVADTGRGIAPEDLEKIFLPFWTRRFDGSSGRGLGLAIVRSVLDRNQGEVHVDSVVGRGTVFILTFPDPDHEPGVPAPDTPADDRPDA